MRASVPQPTRIERAARDSCASDWLDPDDHGRLTRRIAYSVIIGLSLLAWAVCVGLPIMLWGT